MFTSDTERKKVLISLVFHACFSAFIALFGAVYEIYSHGVYSYFMIYAFAIPFAFGVLPYLFIGLLGKKMPSDFARNFWNYGIVTLTLGSVMRGVLDIYGTDNFTIYLFLAGVPLALVGLTGYLVGLLKGRSDIND